jgi:hypothetical protein
LLADVRIDAMREEARGEHDESSLVFRGGASTFFNKGTNGRWRDVLTDDDLALYEGAAAALDPTLRAWLEGGRRAAAPATRLGAGVRGFPAQMCLRAGVRGFPAQMC